MTRDSNAREAVAQPLVAAHPARTRSDWTARPRGTVLDALKYSEFVVLMKRILPISAAVVLVAVIAYSLIPRQPDRVTFSYERMGTIHNDLAMINPRLSGTDAKGNPFVITADAAIQDPKNVRRGHLMNVQADLALDSRHWLNAMAKEGEYDMDAGFLKLTGGIAIYSDSGYELHTAKADADLKKGIFTGPGEVTGHGPRVSFRADRFVVDRLKQQILLNGNVQTIITPGDDKK
jgi:lipopolysaccharide export system protein LptC